MDIPPCLGDRSWRQCHVLGSAHKLTGLGLTSTNQSVTPARLKYLKNRVNMNPVFGALLKMTILDTGFGRTNPFIDWAGHHGAAVTLLACATFWGLVGVAIYLGVQYF
jgi:hypothetical protein